MTLVKIINEKGMKISSPKPLLQLFRRGIIMFSVSTQEGSVNLWFPLRESFFSLLLNGGSNHISEQDRDYLSGRDAAKKVYDVIVIVLSKTP